jgi:hypothetical protein
VADEQLQTQLESSEVELRRYANTIWKTLEDAVGAPPFAPRARGCELVVVDRDPAHPGHQDHDHAGINHQHRTIHRIAWELLEGFEPRPGYVIKVDRVFSYNWKKNWVTHDEYLQQVQEEPQRTFKILVVVARNLGTFGDDHDVDPDIAQFPLIKFQRKFRDQRQKHRLLVEIVRPGSLEDLQSHLQKRGDSGLFFNIIHFDMHGRLVDSNDTCVPIF